MLVLQLLAWKPSSTLSTPPNPAFSKLPLFVVPEHTPRRGGYASLRCSTFYKSLTNFRELRQREVRRKHLLRSYGYTRTVSSTYSGLIVRWRASLELFAGTLLPQHHSPVQR